MVVPADRANVSAEYLQRLAGNAHDVKGHEGERDEKHVHEHQPERHQIRVVPEQRPADRPGRGQADSEEEPVEDEQEHEDRCRHLLARCAILAVQEVAHESAVESPAVGNLHERFNRDQDEQRAVIRGCEDPDVDGQKQEIDDRNRGVARAVNGDAGREAAEVAAHHPIGART